MVDKDKLCDALSRVSRLAQGRHRRVPKAPSTLFFKASYTMDYQRTSSDPNLLNLFDIPRPMSSIHDPPTNAASEKPAFCIEIPRPPSFRKDLYEPVPEIFKDGVDFVRDDLETVVGEWRDGRALYYYVRFVDGLVHKVCL